MKVQIFNEISKKISFHAVYDNSILEALKYAQKNGFSGIQIAVETPHLSFEHQSDSLCSEIKRGCKKYKLYISLHGPDAITSLFSINEHIKKGIFAYYRDLFRFAEKIGSKLITIHLGNITKFPTDNDPLSVIPDEDAIIYKKTLKNNLETLLKLANNKFVICIENYRLEPLVFEVLQPYLKQQKIWLCWDLAKTYKTSLQKDEKIESFFLKNVKSIKQVHLHDIDSFGKSHKVIGSGIIDFEYFLMKLKISEVMDFCVEVRPRDKAYDSLLNLKRLISSNN